MNIPRKNAQTSWTYLKVSLDRTSPSRYFSTGTWREWKSSRTQEPSALATSSPMKAMRSKMIWCSIKMKDQTKVRSVNLTAWNTDFCKYHEWCSRPNPNPASRRCWCKSLNAHATLVVRNEGFPDDLDVAFIFSLLREKRAGWKEKTKIELLRISPLGFAYYNFYLSGNVPKLFRPLCMTMAECFYRFSAMLHRSSRAIWIWRDEKALCILSCLPVTAQLDKMAQFRLCGYFNWLWLSCNRLIYNSAIAFVNFWNRIWNRKLVDESLLQPW